MEERKKGRKSERESEIPCLVLGELYIAARVSVPEAGAFTINK